MHTPAPRTPERPHRIPAPRRRAHPHRIPRPCAHCGRTGDSYRRRGLCRDCYGRRSVRRRHPVLPGGVGDERGAYRCLACRGLPVPTAALPGTEAKVLAMIGRASARRSLFHPLDAAVPLDAPAPARIGCP